MPNMNSYTKMHNRKTLNNKTNETCIYDCNCRRDSCPLSQMCQTSIIYQANIDSGIAFYKRKCYLGSCETFFKEHYNATGIMKITQSQEI